METEGYIRQAYSCDGKNFLLLEVDTLFSSNDKQAITFHKPGKKKRSLDANAYHWVLCQKIASIVKSDSESVHYDLMLKYGTPWLDEDGRAVTAILPPQADIRILNIYARILRAGAVNEYLLIKPSRYYDQAEMARLIEGTVDEAKWLDIETLTPRELAEMGIKKEEYESAR